MADRRFSTADIVTLLKTATAAAIVVDTITVVALLPVSDKPVSAPRDCLLTGSGHNGVAGVAGDAGGGCAGEAVGLAAGGSHALVVGESVAGRTGVTDFARTVVTGQTLGNGSAVQPTAVIGQSVSVVSSALLTVRV